MKRRARLLLIGLLLGLPAGAADCPTGAADCAQPRPADQLLKALLAGKTSEADEAALGRQIAGNLLGAAPLVRDAALQGYVNRVGRWVALQGERPDLPWRFGVIDSESINAFATPGGYVLLTKGLYRKLDNEAQLAAVLGHEIAHVIRKHHLKLLRETQVVAALGAYLGDKLKKESMAMQNFIGNGAEIVARGLDKDAEYEADRMGLILAARAGYEADALPAVLAEIGHVPGRDARVALLYETHPHPDDRVARLAEAASARAQRLPEGQAGAERFYRLR